LRRIPHDDLLNAFFIAAVSTYFTPDRAEPSARLSNNALHRNPAYQAPQSDFEQQFIPLTPMLTMLKETIESVHWVQNQLALRILFWIADMYKVEVENEAG
jgi:hypothetical protein